MPNTHHVILQRVSDFFVRITRDGETLTAMTFQRDTVAEEATAAHAKAQTEYDGLHAEWQALPEDERGAFLVPAPYDLPLTSIPLDKDVALAALDPKNGALTPTHQLFRAEDIECKVGGLWRSVQWDSYIHGAYTGLEASGIQNWVLTVDTDGYVYAPYNHMVMAAVTRDTSDTQMRIQERMALVNVFVPFQGATLDQSSILIHASPNLGYATNLTVTEVTSEQVGAGLIRDRLAKIKLSVPDAVQKDGVVQILITAEFDGKPLANHAMWINLSSTAGYIAQRRVLVDGVAAVSFRALDLAFGTVVTISAGFDNAIKPVDAIITVGAEPVAS
jgi:hypothetical protein